ncbi:uncharacterized protein M6G45_015711 [Spheniscus humboldti]
MEGDVATGQLLVIDVYEDCMRAMEKPSKQVKALVEFLTENCCEIFGEGMAGLSSPPAVESPAPMGRSTELPLEEQRGPAGEAEVEHQAKALLDAPPSLLVLPKAAGADTGVGSETAEAPVALPPSTPETTVASLGCVELKSLSEERRLAGSPPENEDRRKRKREEAWAEERECQQEKKRRKEGRKRWGLKKSRKVQKVKKSSRLTWSQ